MTSDDENNELMRKFGRYEEASKGENRGLKEPDELYQEIRVGWYARTWWGKLKLIPVLAVLAVVYPPLLGLNRLADRFPDTYKEGYDGD